MAAILSVLFSMGSAATVSVNQSATVLEPGQNQSLASFEVSAADNDTELVDVTENFPFPVWVVNQTRTVSSQTINNTTIYTTTITGDVVVQPPTDFQPGERQHTVFLTTQQETLEHMFYYTIPARRNWTLTNLTVTENLSVGSSGRVARFVIENTGNVEATINVSATGALAEHLLLAPVVKSVPNVPKPVVVEAQVPKQTPFGNYSGQLQLRDGALNRTVNLSTSLVDTIAPRKLSQSIPGFQATKPEPFRVEAVDNLNVTVVNATVRYTETVVINETTNETQTVNQTLAQLSFEQQAQTTQWTATLAENDRPSDYRLDGVIQDASGNTVRFTDAFTIHGLNVTRVLRNATLPLHRSQKWITYEIGALEKETPLEITLESFDHSLASGNATWRVGIEAPGLGRAQFDAVGDTITVEQDGPIKLRVYSDTADVFAGELSFTGVQSHIPIQNLNFDGEFSVQPVPEYEQFEMSGITHECRPEQSDVVAAAGWECDYFIPVTAVDVDSSLASELQAVTPKSLNETRQVYQDRIAQATSTTVKYKIGFVIVLVLLVLLGVWHVYATRFAPYHYSVYLKDTTNQ